MKRIEWLVILMIIGFVSVTNAWSQSLGITGGVNIASFNGIKNASTKNGMIIGGFINYGFIGGVSLQPEVLFSVKGASATVSPDNGSILGQLPEHYSWTLNYIEVPILLKMDVLDVPILPVNVDIFAGPDFAFNVGSKYETTFGGVTTTTDGSGETHPFDFNIAVGGGPNINLGTVNIGAEVRYTFGTGPVFKNSLPTKPFADVKNGTWSIMASVGL